MTTTGGDRVVGVLPTYNEAANVEKAVGVMLQVPEVDRVLVVDGDSEDETRSRARAAGAEVIVQQNPDYPAKGDAIQTALERTDEDILAFFDADVHNIDPGMISKLIEPLAEDSCDHVLATFDRAGGRVTELTAKPLLEFLFPEVEFNQPLTGEFASRREALRAVDIEQDWGVESGLVIDMVMKGFRVKEVPIGYKDHDMKDLHQLKDMARQVTRTMIQRAFAYGRLRPGPRIDVKELVNA